MTLTSLAGTSGRLCDPPPPLFRSDGRNECEPTRCLRRVTASSSAASTVCNGENAMIPLERTARAGADLGGDGPEGPLYHRPRQSCKVPLRLRAQTPLIRTRPGPGRPGTHPGPGRCCFLPSRPPLSPSPPHGLAPSARLCSEPASGLLGRCTVKFGVGCTGTWKKIPKNACTFRTRNIGFPNFFSCT